MQGIHEFIVQIKEPLKKKVKVGETELYVDPSYDQTKYSERVGTVISTPLNLETEIKPGDEVVIVHTVLMRQLYKEGRQESMFLMDAENGYYRLEDGMIIMFRPNKEVAWRCNGINLMVEPIEATEEDYKIGQLTLPKTYFDTNVECNTNGFLKQVGSVAFINSEMEKSKVNPGDKIYFKDFGDYEFNIDGKVYYCMDNKDVLSKLE